MPDLSTRAASEADALDAHTVIAATHAISNEITLDGLLAVVTRIAMENTGAQRGFLLLEKNGEWVVAARGEPGTEISVLPRTDTSGDDLVSLRLVRSVVSNRELTILQDAASEGGFVDDPHISAKKTRSLVCVPLLSHNTLMGVLYLENNSTAHAFTPSRIRTLELILPQMATSLESALVHESLQESEMKYRRIVDTSAEGIWLLGPDASGTFVNARMAEMLGYPSADLVGRPMADFICAEDMPDHVHKMRERRLGHSGNYERRFIRRDGRQVWTHVAATPIFDEKHRYEGSFGMFTDITERKRTEDALRQSEARLNEAQRIAHLGNWELDLVNNHLRWSDEIYRMFEIDQRKFGASFEAFLAGIHPDDRDLVNNAYSQSVANHTPYDIVHRLLMRDGRTKFVNERCETTYGADGQPLRSIGTVHDITERQRAEDAVTTLNQQLELRVAERTAELEAAIREQEAFSYSISHDLRSPLRAIDGFSRLLVQEYDSQLDDNGRRYLNVIHRNVTRMGDLIDDILDFSRMSRRDMSMTPVDMTSLAREVFDEVRAVAPPQRDIVLRLGDLPPALGDRATIRQVLVNLISNAVKFTEPRAQAVIEVAGEPENGQNVYRVTDNGVGFDMRFVDKLFGVFQRLHRDDEFEGTGIGLAIVKRVVNRHGGRVWAQGAVDQGATLHFTLPSAAAHHAG